MIAEGYIGFPYKLAYKLAHMKPIIIVSYYTNMS